MIMRYDRKLPGYLTQVMGLEINRQNTPILDDGLGPWLDLEKWTSLTDASPPSVQEVEEWAPSPISQLPALDSARQAKWLAARKASANALLAEGWTLEQTMAAGAEFVNAYAALSFGYWYGGAAGSTPQTNLLLAIQADTEREWLDLGSPTVREQMLAILQ